MLDVDSIKKSFDKCLVLKRVSFSVAPGEIFGIVGKKDSGKTTLMDVLAGMIPASSGTCKFNGLIIGPDRDSVKIGYLTDPTVFYEEFTTDGLLKFLLEDESEKCGKLLMLLSLPENVKISRLSAGERQMLGMAAALIDEPDIFLLDNPVAGLDLSDREKIFEILSQLKQTGMTIIITSRNGADIEKICDRIAVLEDGVIKNIR